MSLICLEGADASGKSTLINQLKEKYGFSSFAFPTPKYQDKLKSLSTQHLNSEGTLIYYHTIFEMDFLEHYETLRSLMKKGKHVLLDRYFISNLAYASINFHNKYHLSTSNFLSILDSINHRHITPDLVLFLRLRDPQHFKPKHDSLLSQKELSKLQERYSDILMILEEQKKIKDYETIYVESEEDRVNTMEKVETVLVDRGFL